MTTQKQIEANRRNAKASTGPKSVEGRAKARMNRLTHGLRAEQVVLPTEDAGEFQAFVDAWVDDWKPTTMARLVLVEEAAASAWRKRRFVRAEASRVADRLDRCRANARRRQREAIDRLVDRLAVEPFEVEQALRSTRAGTARLIGMWEELADGLTGPRDWNDGDDHHLHLFHLMGQLPGDDDVQDVFADSWRLYLTNADLEEPADGHRRFSKREEDAAVARLHALMARRIEALTEHWHALPDDSPALDRSAEGEALAPTKDDMLALRYEAQRSREFHRALGDLTKLTKTGDDLVEDTAEAAAPNEAISNSQIEDEHEVRSELSDGGPAAERAEIAADEPARADGGEPAKTRASTGAGPGDLRKTS